LDIGANLGYFCHCAEELGYDCLAVESCPRLAYFLERLRRAESRRFDVFCGSVLEYPFHEPFDVVLALNVFHHFLKSESSHRRLIEMLGRMRMREMIFQSHKPGERQMASAFRDYSPEEFVAFLLDHSCLASAEYIGADRERPIYRLRAA
jgi:SAM-dependent methyltransferase